MCLKNTYANLSAMLDSLYSIKYAYLVSLSVITNIESYSTLVNGSIDFGNLTIKSSTIDPYALASVFSNFSFL